MIISSLTKPPFVNRGFTIVELLVVTAIVGILAGITLVSYTGISQKAIASSLQSDLVNSTNRIKMYRVENGSYPTSITDDGNGNYCPTPADTRYCVKTSTGTTFTYSSIVPSTFHLTGTNSNITYSVNDNSSPTLATTPTTPSLSTSCPTGFIPVPGSGTYGTSDFCTMKYEAKNVGGVATSQTALIPWGNISQTDAITTASTACANCHLTTEAEFLTIAQNVLSVASNWSTGTVGSGYVYSGHNDSSPNNAVAVTNPNDGYSDTGNVSGNQRRTLTLSNGEVIWDLSGNVWEWTSGTVQSPVVQPGLSGTGIVWRQWNDVNIINHPGTILPNPSPAATGITGSGSWDSSNGIGYIASNADETSLRSFARGADYGSGVGSGLLTLNLASVPSFANSAFGFRVCR